MRFGWLVALLLLVVPAVAPAAAQSPTGPLYQFELEPPGGERVEVDIGTLVHATLVFRDLSRDSTQGLDPEAPLVAAEGHSVSWRVEPWDEDRRGWFYTQPGGFQSYGGEVREVRLPVGVGPQAQNPFFKLNVTAVVQAGGDTHERSVTVLFFSPGIAGFQVRPLRSLDLEPHEVGDAGVILTNIGLFPRTFETNVSENPCGLPVVAPGRVTLEGKSSKEVPFSVQAPESRPYYVSEDCTLRLEAWAVDNPGVKKSTTVGVTVDGFYVDPVWVFWTVGILLAAALVALLAKRRKERIEEELLGKPQKPWLIPVEQVYLRRLKEEDERAWYIVRHHLMEEEYASALLWYHNEKKATRTGRRKERLILREERDYERWKKKWQKRIDKPLVQAGHFEAVLQKKLDRKARKEHRKLRRKHRKLVAKLQAHHEQESKKALAKWEKKKARAEKKGRPVPERPVVPEPDLPEVPEPVPRPLADSPWAKKAAKNRARMERRQGDLEVRFEKADLRRRRKLVKRLHRLAQKLDDPTFVEEHPLLRAEA